MFKKICENPLVAGEWGSQIIWLSRSEIEEIIDEDRDWAKEKLLSLASTDYESAQEWSGIGALTLRQDGKMTNQELIDHLNTSENSAISAIHNLENWMADEYRENWVKEVLLALANHSSDRVGGAVVHLFTSGKNNWLLEDPGFCGSIAKTKGARGDLASLIEAIDEFGNLLSVERQVLELCKQAVTPSASPREGARRIEVACGILSRLIEEAEREGDLSLRSECLDIWDSYFLEEYPQIWGPFLARTQPGNLAN